MPRITCLWAGLFLNRLSQGINELQKHCYPGFWAAPKWHGGQGRHAIAVCNLPPHRFDMTRSDAESNLEQDWTRKGAYLKHALTRFPYSFRVARAYNP
jgi:hypothetical protein